MDRRSFISATGIAAAGTGVAAELVNSTAVAAPKKKPVKMVLGTQRSPTNSERLQYFKRHGVNNICGYPPHPGKRGHWTLDDLKRTKDLCEKHDVTLDMVALPFLTSSHIDRETRGSIMLAKSPQRDRDIADIHKMIEGCAKVGIPAFKYNMSILGVPRTKPTPGRGGSVYSTWKAKIAKPPKPLTRAGAVTPDKFWERITYFLDRVIPVCNEHKIRAACHPHDPGVPASGYQGVHRVLGTVEGLQKFVQIQESPYHGLNLCLGSVAEMLQNPKKEIHDAIRWFGRRRKIFNIHFRNIRGHRGDFMEVWPDEGDMDMFEVIKTLYEVDYPYMVMPDHIPKHPHDPAGRQGFAFCFGYIKALLQVLKAQP